MNERHARLAAALLALATVLADGSSRAAEPTASERATARALFDEGRKLVEAKDYAQACPKFEESQRLDPGVGTLFNLADCYERQGRTATAWTLFLEVASMTKVAGQSAREEAARERAAQLDKRLSRLRIIVPPETEVAGLSIRRDGEIVGKATWGIALPVDPGKHSIEVHAPGRASWTQQVVVGAGPSERSIAIPTLPPEGAPAALPRPAISAAVPASTSPAPATPVTKQEPVPSRPGSTQRTVGLVLAGAGVVGVGVGTALAFGAKSKFNESAPYCDDTGCDPEGLSIRESAVSRGNTATVVWGLGLAAIAGGAVLYLVAPQSKQGSPSASLHLNVGPGNVQLGGRF